jgi:glycosyltransferase involved in cell wall biosynthesis
MNIDSINLDDGAPLLSVLLASYNQAKFVVNFINGWKSQSFQNFEIIAVDNYSTDGTAELLQGYSKVRLIQEKSTPAQAWLTALDNCKGKYLIIGTTSDYICSNTWVERALETLESDSELSLVWSSGIHISESGWFEGVYGYRFLRSPLPAKRSYLPYWLHDNYIPELGSVVSTRVYRECLDDYLSRKVDITFFTVSFRYEFTARGFLQKYIPDLAFAGRTHKAQLREIWADKEFQFDKSIKEKQMQMLKDILIGKHNYKYLDRYNNELGKLILADRILLLPRVLSHKLKFQIMNLIVCILKIIRGS